MTICIIYSQDISDHKTL